MLLRKGQFEISCNNPCTKNDLDIACVKCSFSSVKGVNLETESIYDKQDEYAGNFGA